MAEAVATGSRRITAEEFYDLFAGSDFELVDGRVVDRRTGRELVDWEDQIAGKPAVGSEADPMTSPTHGLIDFRFACFLGAYLAGHPVGQAYTNTGFILRRNPDLTRGPDLAFVSHERAQQCPPPPRGFWAVAPDLVVEVISPDDRADEVSQKLSDYLQAGVRLVWLIYPRQQCVHVYHASGEAQMLSAEGELRGEPVLPGFRLSLAQLWV